MYFLVISYTKLSACFSPQWMHSDTSVIDINIKLSPRSLRHSQHVVKKTTISTLCSLLQVLPSSKDQTVYTFSTSPRSCMRTANICLHVGQLGKKFSNVQKNNVLTFIPSWNSTAHVTEVLNIYNKMLWTEYGYEYLFKECSQIVKYIKKWKQKINTGRYFPFMAADWENIQI